MTKIKKMFALAPLCAALHVSACGSGLNQDSNTKIVGGERVPIGEWRSTVALTHPNGGVFCSGTALNRNLVVTAAHCLKGRTANDIKVYTGSGDFLNGAVGQYSVSRAVASPKYKDVALRKDNDIAYLLLKTSIDYPDTSFVKVLTDPYEIKELLRPGAKTHLVGFGLRDSNRLGEKWQNDTYIGIKDPKTWYNKKTEISVGGYSKDSCGGDSGGPAYGQLKNGQWRVYGVTSRGVGCGNGGVYGLIHANICWILDETYIDLGLPEGYCNGPELSSPL